MSYKDREPVTVIIRGLPIALKRPRFCRAPQMKSGVRVYSTQHAQFKIVQDKARKQLPEDWKPYNKLIGLNVAFRIYFRIPISCPKNLRTEMIDVYRNKKPDLSNLLKFYEDALNKILWTDDSQICQILTYKAYSDHPRVEIEVTPVRAEYDVKKEMQEMRKRERNI